MILINDNWVQIYDLQDVSKIIRENFSYDLADELDKLIPEHSDEEYYDLNCELDDAYDEIAALEEEIAGLENDIEALKDEIRRVESVNKK